VLELLGGALGIGWPLFVFLIGLLIYFQVSIPDAAKKKRLSFKTLIGMLAGFMAFMAISNYGTNFDPGTKDFAGNSGLLPISLVMGTILAYIMGIYFTNLTALFKIGSSMFLVGHLIIWKRLYHKSAWI